MPKVGPAPPFDVYEGGLVEPAEAEQDFRRALTEVRAVSGALEVCYGKGEASVTGFPERSERSQQPEQATVPWHPGPVDRRVSPGALPPIDTEVDGYLVGLDLPRPRPDRRKSARLLEEGRTPGESCVGKKADLKV